MKKILGILLCVGMVFGFYGCKDNPEDPDTVAAPTSLTIVVAGNDSLSIKLSWTASTDDVNGYIVYCNDAVVDSVDSTTCDYTYTPTALGDYEVTAYIGGTESNAATASTKLVEALNEGPVYIVPSAGGPSGYGWGSDGSGAEYSLGTAGNRQNTTKVDFVFDTDSTITDPNTFDAAFTHATGVAYNAAWGYTTLAQAPITGYTTFEKIVNGGTFVLWVQGKYYVKMETTTGTIGGDLTMTFKYGIQTVAGFRGLK